MNTAYSAPHEQIARRFYDGMTQATIDARNLVLPLLVAQFSKRGIGTTAEQSFNKVTYFHKRLDAIHNGLPGAPILHGTSRFSMEYFCCISALNLYRLPRCTEQFKAELLTESFHKICTEQELDWLGVYNATTPSFKRDTGHAPTQWRNDIIKIYLIELRAKSSRDADTLVATRRFLERQQLSKGTGVDVTPAMQESCAEALESNAGWLERYLKFNEL